MYLHFSLKKLVWVIYEETLWLLLILLFSVLVYRNEVYNVDNFYYSPPLKYELTNNFLNPTHDENSAMYKSVKYPHIIYYEKLFNVASLEKPTRTVTCNNGLKCDVSYYPRTLPIQNTGAYIIHLKKYPGISHEWPIRRYGTHIWALLQEESPIYCKECLDEEFLNLFNFSSTFSRDSDIPFPLLNMVSLNNITNKIFFVETKKKNCFLKEISPILYLQSNCQTFTGRDLYIYELMKYVSIDSYGTCLNNKILPPAYRRFGYKYLEEKDFLHFMAKYKFMIAIENGVCEDYVTEKFWRAIHLGVVPIYFGSPSIRDWLPNVKSAILLDDFPTPKLLSAHINELMQDDDLYEEYLDHKMKGIITNQYLVNELKMRPYQTDFELIKKMLECLLCEKLYNMREAPLRSRVVNKTHYCPALISDLSLDWNLIIN